MSEPAVPKPTTQRSDVAYWVLGAASLVYVAASLLTPVDKAARTYSLSPTAIHSLELTILFPLIIVWYIALWGSLRFRAYALSIQSSPDGRALKTLANGLVTLVSGLVVSALLQSFNNRMIAWGHADSWTIFSSYVTILFALVALGLILRGAWRLAALVNFRRLGLAQALAAVVLAVIGVIYVLLLVHDPYRNSTPDPSVHTSYYLRDWLLLITVVLPYLVVWYCGLLAVGCLRIYQAYSGGIIYRRALNLLSSGLLAVIAASILIQLIDALSPSLVHTGLRYILLLVYALIVVYAIGHIVVAMGARRLTRIEEAGAA